MKPRFKPGDLIMEAVQYSGYNPLLPGQMLIITVEEFEGNYSYLIGEEKLKARINYVDRYCMLLKDWDSRKRYKNGTFIL